MNSADHPKPPPGFDLITGGYAIVSGLAYHFRNFQRLDRLAIEIEPKVGGSSMEKFVGFQKANYEMKHEAVAYFNRLGQMFYFAKSKAVLDCVPNSVDIIPTIKHFLPFRMKQSAHRATDYPDPRKPFEEHPKMMRHLDYLFSEVTMRINGRPVFEIVLKDQAGGFYEITFDMLKDHVKIIDESNELMERIRAATNAASK
jgi:hypothetical protein